eukprot:Gb_41535 [translate_table: standard]
MGTFIGHVLPGAGFVAIGLWHLINIIANYAHSPWDFHTRPWFPSNFKFKYMELLAIMAGSCLSIAAELFIGPQRHQPLADDWSIPPEHLNNFEHSSISLFFFIYAAVALYVDVRHIRIPHGMLHVMAALAFSQELLLFHLHSADHMGVEGQYHWLLQLIVGISLSCTLLEIPCPNSFVVAMVRAMSIVFQGCWFIHMGFMLWIPAFVPKGCRMHHENGHSVVRCGDQKANMRAKALANLQFNWYLASIALFTIVLYVRMVGQYHQNVRYEPLEQKPARNEGAKDVEMGSPSKGHRPSLDGSLGSYDLDHLQDTLDLER